MASKDRDGGRMPKRPEPAIAKDVPTTKDRAAVLEDRALGDEVREAVARLGDVAAEARRAAPSRNGQAINEQDDVRVANEEAPVSPDRATEQPSAKAPLPGDEQEVAEPLEAESQVAPEAGAGAEAQTTAERTHVSGQILESIGEALSPRQTLPGFADPRIERAAGVDLPPWFIDRCRRAYMSVPFDPAAPCRVLGVTSTTYGEGKTSVAIGTATAMAVDTKKPTLLLECDFAAPSLHKFLGIDRGRGLAEWLEGDTRLRIVRGGALVPNVFMIPAGAPRTDPAHFYYELIDREVMTGLRESFGNVVIDLPPTLSMSYGALAYALADYLIIVARSGVTLTENLENSITQIGRDRVSGIVLNGTDYRTPAWLRSRL